ncbi:MAG: GntR family transcriptional regulator [Chloroflexi bacterium]|nr:GntR family transcriptional regulator [Chloroflexota bacterium]
MTVTAGHNDRSRAEVAYEAIKRAIVEVRIRPGQRFTESTLARELGITKTPIRDALQRLVNEGLVESSPRSGYRATPVTLKQARDLFGLRALLESEAAALAASRVQDIDHLNRLDELCRTSYDPSDAESIRTFLIANTAFHTTVATASGNARLARALTEVLVELERLFHLGLALTSRADEIVHEHRDLLQAIVAGDPERARQVALLQARAAQAMVTDALMASPALLETNVTPMPRP